MAKYRLQLIRLGDVLKDESVDDSSKLRLNSGFIPKRGIRLMQTNYPSQTDNSSLI